jgi:hypothetical protein
MLWKLNAAFPSVVWQVYDWFLQPNAGYYFMQNACEPIHIQLNLNDLKVLVLNRTHQPAPGLVAQVDIFSLDSRSLFHEGKSISLSATEVNEATSLSSVLANSKGVNFVVLNLKNNTGKVISHNVYWLSNDGDYKSLNEMQKTNVQTKVLTSAKGKSENSWTIQITNSTNKMAFFIRPQLMIDVEEVLPSYWSGNYFTLAPSESTTVTVSCPVQKLDIATPILKISGWNVEAQELVLPN